MGNFKRDDRSGGGRGGKRGGFGGRDSGRSFGGGRDSRGPSTMHKATCSECGQSCEVPFRPSGDKPIYCNNCFADKRGGEAPRRPERSNFSSGGFGGDRDSGRSTMHKVICDECGKSCEVPFRPSGDKPVYCSECFGGNKRSEGGNAPRQESNRDSMVNGKQLIEQFAALNKKLDKLIAALVPEDVRPVFVPTPKTKEKAISKEDKKIIAEIKEEVKEIKKEKAKKAVVKKVAAKKKK